MSMFGDYIKEREGKEIFENEHGFATFVISGEECYIQDIYVKPEYRRFKYGTVIGKAVEDIAIKRGCKFLSGTVYPKLGDPTASTKSLFSFGFKISGCEKDVIFFTKEI